jgi:hypothetical protein
MSLRSAAPLIALIVIAGCRAEHRSDTRAGTKLHMSDSPVPPTDAPTVHEQPSSRPDPQSASKTISPFPDITLRLESERATRVEIRAWTCTPEYPLEQIACSPATREHESLMVVTAKPSQIHAALLMAGFAPGTPGRWTYDNNTIGTIAPTGDQVDVLVRHADKQGRIVEHPIGDWIRDIEGKAAFPKQPWVFGGSVIAKNTARMGPGQHYVADMSGSIIGLVTFGDEVLGFSSVISDQADVQAAEWEAKTDEMPPVGAQVTLVLVKHVQ